MALGVFAIVLLIVLGFVNLAPALSSSSPSGRPAQ
jgi:hypothetical protein